LVRYALLTHPTVWTPAFAGVTKKKVIPAQAGIQGVAAGALDFGLRRSDGSDGGRGVSLISATWR